MTHPSVNSIVDRLTRIADAPRRADGSDIPLGEQCLEAATIISELQATVKRLTANPADQRYWEGRYRDEAAALSRIKEETIEALQQIETVCIDNAGDTVRHDLALKFVGGIAAKAIRSLGSTGGAEKTAESEHSPSTQNTRTE